MSRRASKGKSNSLETPTRQAINTIQQLDLLRNFCPSFSEQDLSTCLSQAGYNVELAAERLLSGHFKASKFESKPIIVSISSVKKAPPSTTSTSSASARQKRPSPDYSHSKPTTNGSSSDSRPEKKRSPHIIPPTPAAPKFCSPTSLASTALLLCERWLVGTCTTRHGRVSHNESLELSHYEAGINMDVRFRGSAVEGYLSRSLSAMLTPLLRVDHRPKLIELRAQALMDDQMIPIGGDVPLKLAVYISAPKAFFAIFGERLIHSDSKSSSSMYFAKEKTMPRKGSNKSLPDVAFAFLQWAQYGELPEIPDFSTVLKESAGDDNTSGNKEECQSDDAIVLAEEDFTPDGDDERPEWAKSVTESDQVSTLPEMEDPRGLEGSIVLRPYQRQALYWMMKREQKGESQQELEKELKLLSELASGNNPNSSHSLSPFQRRSYTGPDIICDCGPVLVSETAKHRTKTLDGQANPVNHPLWQMRYLGNDNLETATLFYVHELLGIATCHPPAPPKHCRGGILADDMGLGKTVMLLALVLKCKEEYESQKVNKYGPTLVVVPLSLISQWEEEIETKTGLSYLVWYGDQTKGKYSEDDFDCDIVITSYGTIQAEMQKGLKKEKTNSCKGLLGREWLRVILDEGHCVKNQATLASKACCSLNTTYRWVVTGTVIHNSLDDVFALIKFLQHQPWCEPSFWKVAISNEMNRTAEKEPPLNDDFAEPTGMMVALGRVRRLLAPLMLRRTKDSLTSDGKPILTLPPIETRVVSVQLTRPEREFYNALLEKSQDVFDGFIKAGTASKSWLAIFSLLHRLRMACDHIALTVKSHIDEAEWNQSAAQDGPSSEKAAVTPQSEESPRQSTVDDAFITGLLKQFRQSAQATSSIAENEANSYSDKVAHALNAILKDNAIHVSEECPVCLDTPLIHKACITPCGHIFCRKCLVGVLKTKAVSGSRTPEVPDGDCPVCNTKVESSSVIILAKGKEGGYTSNFLNDKSKRPTPVRLSKANTENDMARQVLENAVNGAKSSKLAAIMRELHAVWVMDPGSKVLIFSQFLGFLDLLETALREDDIPFGRLDGKMTLKQRVAALDSFKDDSKEKITSVCAAMSAKQRQGSVLLVSMKAGGVGLNLVAASTVFIADPWWNQSIEDQCINRVHRIGQKSKVRVSKFVVVNSVEERIVELQRKKKHMASEVYSDIRADGTMSDARPTIDDFKLIFGNLT